MEKYYMIHSSLFEHIGNNTFKCIASTRKNMLGTMIIKPDLHQPWVHSVTSKDEAIHWMKEDAYWDNVEVYTLEGR